MLFLFLLYAFFSGLSRASDNVIGMIFLIDIDGWARSARIQVVLGKDYRGRGYSRDIMPPRDDVRLRAGTGGPRHAPHLGGRAGTDGLFQTVHQLFVLTFILAVFTDKPRQLDFGIADIVYEWAQGESLSRVLYGTDLTGGDFVRNCKRLADVLQQIAVAEPYLTKRAGTLALVAKQAMEAVNRGVVAYSGVD